jgi:DcmR-like sensory protein
MSDADPVIWWPMPVHVSPPPFASGPTPPTHICGVFESEFERRSALRKFFRIGLLAGERCAVNIDRDDPSDTLAAIGTADEIGQWREEGLLTVLPAPTAADSTGLTIDEMLDVWDSFTEEAKRTPTRIGGEATWWLHIVSVDTLLEYERELESSMPQGLSALCLYDSTRFDADALECAMQIHPHKVTQRSMFVENHAYRS